MNLYLHFKIEYEKRPKNDEYKKKTIINAMQF